MRIDKATGLNAQLTGSFSGSFTGVGNFTGLEADSVAWANITSKPADIVSSSAQLDSTFATDADVTAVDNKVTFATASINVNETAIAALNAKTLVSSSNQIASDISGSFTATSASIALDLVTNYLKNTTDNFTGSLDVSGSFKALTSETTGITRFANGLAIDEFGNISGSNSYNIQGTYGLTIRNGSGNDGGFLSISSGGATLGANGGSSDQVTIGNNGNTVVLNSNGGFGTNGGDVRIESKIFGTGTETSGDISILSNGGTNGTAGKITLNAAEIQATGSIKALNDVIVSNDVQADSIGIGTAASGTTGEIRATGDITAFYSSDERLKENFKNLDGALDKVNKIGGYEFDWKDGIEDVVSKKGHDIGVKAQELQAQYPDLVHERDNGYLAVDYVKLNAVLIEAVKELTARVVELEKRS